MEPAKLKILPTPKDKFRLVGEVTVLDVFQNNTRDFHEAGLFSTTIFGRVGSPERLTRMGYIDIRVPIFHPRIFHHLCALKQLYKGIMSGHEYAIWDNNLKDFVKSDQMQGETGYNFFITHWKDIKFTRTSSTQRDEKIAIVKNAKDVALTDKVLVQPAGLRDLEVDEHGGIDQHEINDFYRNLIKISNTLSTISNLDSPIIDKARFSLQIAFNELHDYILNGLVKGKGSFMAAKFGRRKIKYGTRNVFAAVSPTVIHLDDPTNFNPDHTQVGLFQAIKATEPLMIHHLNNSYLHKIFRGEGYAWLIDPKTLERVEVTLKPRSVDRWTTVAGLTKIINQFQNPKIRHKPVMIEGYHLGLIYKRDGKFKLVFSMDELRPDQMDDRDYITPITYAELFYTLCNRYITDLPTDITRYPIETANSIYPSYNYVMTTTKPLRMTELDEAWVPSERVTNCFPNIESDIWIDTMGLHTTRIEGVGGDYDGDTGNNNVNMSEEAKDSVKNYLNSVKAHIDFNNNMIGSPLTDIPKRVIYNMTGD